MESRAWRRYRYVGPDAIKRSVVTSSRGVAVRAAAELLPFANGEAHTFVIDDQGVLRVADRRSEHVACAGGGEVYAAGELTAARMGAAKGSDAGCRVVEISNQSTGYCPEPASWASVAAALDEAGIGHPGHFTYEAIFRRCTRCRERNLVKEAWFVCSICGADLPAAYNVQEQGSLGPQ